MANNNKEWVEELREILIQHPKEIGETGSLEQWLTEFIYELLQKERQRICEELEGMKEWCSYHSAHEKPHAECNECVERTGAREALTKAIQKINE